MVVRVRFPATTTLSTKTKNYSKVKTLEILNTNTTPPSGASVPAEAQHQR